MPKKIFVPSGAKAVACAVAALGAGQAPAVEFDTGSADFKARLDLTAKYSAAFRLKDRNPALANAGALSANQDDGDNNFGKGLISNRLDLLSEFDMAYGNYGARISAAGWYDSVYNGSTDNTTATANYSPRSDFDPTTRRVMGRDIELLDAMVFGKGQWGERAYSWRLGRHTLLWGESLFFGSNGIAGGQAPLDLIKLTSVPNSTFKEIARPTSKISFQAEVADKVSFGAYYQLEWRPTRLLPAGAYLSNADNIGPAMVPLLAGRPVPREADVTPKDHGQFGLQLRFKSEAMDTDFGFYVIRYHAPGPSNVWITFTPPSPTAFRWVYAEGIRAYGVSASKTIGNVNFGSEVSLRYNAPLSSRGLLQNTASGANMAANNSDNPGYAVGRTAHAQLSWIATLEPSFIAQEASLSGEVAWNTRLKVTDRADLLNPNATKSATGARLVYTPTYRQLLPGWDMSVPVGVGVTRGKSSAVGASFGPDRAGDMNIGITGTYLGGWTAALSYVHYFGAVGTQVDAASLAQYKQSLKDRDFINLSIRNTF